MNRHRPLTRHTPLRRTGPPRRRARLRAVSDKRRRENAERRKVVAQIREERGPWCERCRRHVGKAEHLHPHEVKTRARLGSIVGPANIILLCYDPCHRWAHSNPKAAHREGLLKWSWE